MKKVIIPFILATILLSSCNRDASIDDKLLEKADDIYRTPTVTKDDEYIGDYLPETEYSAGDLSAVNGIRYNSLYYDALADGKYYFDVNTLQTRTNEDGTNGTGAGTATITRSMNLETGESFYLCPDPLCKHPYRVCQYTNLNCVGYYNGNLYYKRHIIPEDMLTMSETIEKLDPSTGDFSVIIEQARDPKENPYTIIERARVVDNQLFYTLLTIEEDSENRTQTQTAERYCIDLDTMEKLSIPENTPNIYYISDTAAYGYSSEYDSVVRTDAEYQNPVYITPPEGYPHYGDMQADENTGEIFILMMEPDRKYGALCKIVGDGMEVLTMPHEKITKFQLTRDVIYYSAYDPVEIGKSARNNGTVTMDDGGKIYSTDRSTRENAELIFSDGVNFNMTDWFVLGDNLYLDSVLRVNEGGSVYFASSRSLKHVRINLINQTVRYFRFD